MKIDKDNIPKFCVHPLGFYYLVLSSSEVTHRLHVYNGDVDFSADNAWHTHEFDLQSRVLVGSIQNHIAEFNAEGEGNLKEFLVKYSDDQSILNTTGRLGEILEIASFTSVAGQDYFIKAGTIHCAKNIESPCVTHVTMRHRGCQILSYGVEEAPFSRRKVNREEGSIIWDILFQNNLTNSSK